MAIIQANLRLPAPPVKSWRILLVQSFTAHMPLLTAANAFGLGRRRWSSPQQCYLHCLHRGISLLSTAGKILARVLLNRLSDHVGLSNIIPESQCGFRAG